MMGENNKDKKKNVNKSSKKPFDKNKKATGKKAMDKKGAGKGSSGKKTNGKNNKQKTSVKKPAAPKLKLPKGWFFMAKEEVSASALAKCLTDAEYDVELWIDAAVVEVSLGEKLSMDFEQFDLPFEDEFSDSFMEKEGLKCAYYVTFSDDSYEKVKGLVSVLREQFGGGLYGDTDDFEPRI